MTPAIHFSYFAALTALLAKHDALDHFWEVRDVSELPGAQAVISVVESQIVDKVGPLCHHDVGVWENGAVLLGYIRVYMDPDTGDIEFCRTFDIPSAH